MFGNPASRPACAYSPADDPLQRISRGAKALLVSSTGGHLAELVAIEKQLQTSADSLWVTFDTPQSASLLNGRRRHFVDYVSPRDLRGAVRAARAVAPLLRRERFDYCLSTGAAVATTLLPLAAWSGIPTLYVESLARPFGPSVTGRVLQWAPRIQTLTQYPGWTSRGWACTRSVLDAFAATQRTRGPGPLKILLTLGTIRPYRFDRAVDAVRSLLRPDDQVTWQLGCTARGDLPGTVLGQVSADDLADVARQADVVVAHAGVGSILQQFALGHAPVLAVRSGRHHEHVDNHQRGIAQTTAARGLTAILDLEAPCRKVLEWAAGHRVVPVGQTDPLQVA